MLVVGSRQCEAAGSAAAVAVVQPFPLAAGRCSTSTRRLRLLLGPANRPPRRFDLLSMSNEGGVRAWLESGFIFRSKCYNELSPQVASMCLSLAGKQKHSPERVLLGVLLFDTTDEPPAKRSTPLIKQRHVIPCHTQAFDWRVASDRTSNAFGRSIRTPRKNRPSPSHR